MKKFFIFLMLVLLLGINIVSANEINDNLTLDDDSSNLEVSNITNELKSDDSSDLIKSGSDVIVVNNWDELQYYASQTDKDYIVKLKENTNFYPTNSSDSNCQIKVLNNFTILGSSGAYIGDNSSIPKLIKYTAIIVQDGVNAGLTLKGIDFKWINVQHSPDAIFLQMAGKSNNSLVNCSFSNINTKLGHSCIVYLKRGYATLDNCTFINCTTDFGCASIFERYHFKSAHMFVKNCYFGNNYARTEPGCINNCALLTVYNTTFYKNRSFWWAGAIHTHGGANTTIYDSNFTDNVAGWNGGALYTYSYLQIYNTIFEGNNCTTNNGGGAIGACNYETAPHIYIENSLFKNNENLCWALDNTSTTGTGRGGAISIMDEGSIEVRNSTFISNAASIGTAICVLDPGGDWGSPNVIIEGNKFINHTRYGDVLYVELGSSNASISDNYYLGNSIEFSRLNLELLDVNDDNASFKINSKLVNPQYYDSDILDKTLYDVYVDNKYFKTVNSTSFTLDFDDLDIFNVYVIPSISNHKSNSLTVISTREYIFISKNYGNDANNGLSRSNPVFSIKKAIELSKNCKNILIMDGDFYEEDLQINNDLTIKGEGNAKFIGSISKSMFSVNASNFTIKNMNIVNLTGNTFVKQNNGNLIILKCLIMDNLVSKFIDSTSVEIVNSIIMNNNAVIVYNNGFASIKNSILINNKKDIISGNIENINVNYNWWGNNLNNLTKPNNLKMDNWLILNITSNSDSLEQNQVTLVQFGFNLVNGDEYLDFPKFNLKIIPVNGSINKNITDCYSTVEYTLTELYDGSLTASYNGIFTTINFKFLKSDPNISFKAKNVMYGDNLVVEVKLPNDISGNLTVCVGNLTQVKEIANANTIFIFENLKAGNYPIIINYTGDKKYLPQIKTTSVTVSKYNSFTKILINEFVVGGDVVLNITVNDDATGNVSISVNGVVNTLILENAKASYTMKNVSRGDYFIRTIYSGDDKYLSSESSYNLEVDNLNSTMDAVIEDITYGEMVTIQITLNDNATGNVSATIDGKTNTSSVVNGKSTITFENIDAGIKNVVIFYTGDDTYFNKTIINNFTINKTNLSFNISSSSIKIGQDAIIYISVPPKVSGTFTINGVTLKIPLSGNLVYIIEDLEIGEYTFVATYSGNNYFTVSNSTTFSVSDYPNSQWVNEGFDTSNSGKSIYDSEVNGNVFWNQTIGGEIVGSLMIDYEGNIYVATKSRIYSFTSNGTPRWNCSYGTHDGNFSGITIGRDVIISPKSGDTLYFINQTTGEIYGSSNIYQGSSLFSPIIDSNANLYIVSEYQVSSNNYNLVIVPFKAWKHGGQIKIVDLGNVKPIASPTLNDDIIVVLSQNTLRVIDAKTLKTIFIKSGNYAKVKPVIGEGNIIYTIHDDFIVAYNSSGARMWKTKVTGGVGNKIILNHEKGVYSVNSQGKLYKYDLISGIESLVSDLSISSGVLIDNNGNLYFASGKMFYGINSDGKVLWKSDLGCKITGNPIMNADGMIYVTSEDNSIFALNSSELINPNLSVFVENGTAVGDVRIIITLNNQASGNISFKIGEKIYEYIIDKGVFQITIPNLPIGNYSINVTYSGDMRFNKVSKLASFVVKDIPMINMNNKIQSDGNSIFTISLPDDAIGNLTIYVDGTAYIINLVKGSALLKIPDLSSGNHNIFIIYLGDDKYAANIHYCVVNIPPVKLSGFDVIMPYTSGVKYKVRLTWGNVNLVGKTITFMVNGKKTQAKTDKYGYASFKINLNPSSKKYTVISMYNGVKTTNKITVKSIISAKNLKVKKSAKTLKIKVSLNKINGKYLKGKKITLKFKGKIYNAKTNKKGLATFNIKKNILKKLKVGKKYSYNVSYLKDNANKKIAVKK